MQQKTILVIDDDVDLIEIMRMTLENAGFAVIDARSGRRREARQWRPHLPNGEANPDDDLSSPESAARAVRPPEPRPQEHRR